MTELVQGALVPVALERLRDQVKALEESVIVHDEWGIDAPCCSQLISKRLTGTQQRHASSRVLSKSRLILIGHRVKLKCCHRLYSSLERALAGLVSQSCTAV